MIDCVSVCPTERQSFDCGAAAPGYGHLSHFFVALHQFRDAIELCLIEFLSALTRARRFPSIGNRALERLHLSRKILRALRLHAIFQPLIKDQAIAQIEDSIMIGGTLDRLEFVRLLALLVDLLQERRQLAEAEIFPVALFPAKQSQNFCILNDESGILICDGRVKKRVVKPFDGRERLSIGQSQRFFAMNDEQRIARHGVEGFDPSADQDRNPAELRKIDPPRNGRRCAPARGYPKQRQGEDQGRSESFHARAVLRRRENPTR